MVFRTQPRPVDFSLSKGSDNPCFKNHQMWQIDRRLDYEAGTFCFRAKSPWGQPCVITEFIVEGVDSDFLSAVISEKKRQESLFIDYLQKQLDQATPYQVHIEFHANRLIIRFGDYGLMGGGKKTALALSGAQVIVGIGLTITGFVFPGGILLGSGLAGGSYAYSQPEGQYDTDEYAKQTAYGGATGFISGGLSHWTRGIHYLLRIGVQAFGGAAGSAAAAIPEAVKEGDPKIVLKKACIGAVGTAVGSLASTTVGPLMNCVAEVDDDIAAIVFKRTLEGGVGAMSSKAATNLCEGEQVGSGVFGAGLVGATISGVIAVGEEGQRYLNQKSVEKALQVAQREKAKSERVVNALEEELRLSEQRLAKQQEELAVLEKTRDLQLDAARKAMQETQRQVEKMQQDIKAAQETLEKVKQQMRIAEQGEQRFQQERARLDARIDKDIDGHLKKGFKAKISGHWTKSKAAIKEAYQKGKTIKWRKGHVKFLSSRETVRFNPEPLQKQQQKIQGELQMLQQQMEGLQGEVRAAQEVQGTEGNAAREQIETCKLEMAKVQQAILVKQEAVAKLGEQVRSVEVAFRAEQVRLQEIAKREIHVQSKMKEMPLLARQIDRLPRRPELGAVFKPEQGAFVTVSMQDLIPHVVLVHALSPQAIGSFIGGHPELLDQWEKDKIMPLLQHIITPDGVIGRHLDLQKRELQGELEKRPQIHWAWNQLVQANSGSGPDGWEDAPIAVLEPLSVFEETLYRRPFGVAPYDTMTFSSHHLSDHSLILISPAVLEKARSYLTGFRGRIVPYEGPIRSAIIDALNVHYPQTWHVCNPAGELIGKELNSTLRREDEVAGGYLSKTCLKKPDGQVITLIEKDGSDPRRNAQPMKEYKKEGRFIGLHAHSITDLIEAKDRFKALALFKQNCASARDCPVFAGGLSKPSQLSKWVARKAIKFHQETRGYDPHTGAPKIANYLFHESLFADLVSMFYQMYPDGVPPLTILDAKLVFAHDEIYRDLVQPINDCITSRDRAQEERAFDLFRSYCEKLRADLKNILRAKEEAAHLFDSAVVPLVDEGRRSPLCLLFAQEEWDKVVVPADSVAFDLERWPHSDLLIDYINKVRCTLPSRPESLQQLYRQICSYSRVELRTPEERKAEYRLNVIRSVIRWACIDDIYRASLRPDEARSSALASAFSCDRLEKYCLETKDFTKLVGDCLFDNVAAQLSDFEGGLRLRKEVVLFMQDHEKEYQQKPDYAEKTLLRGDGEVKFFFDNWEQYLSGMSMPQVWGTEVEIHALAYMLQHPIVVLAVDALPKIYNQEASQEPIFLHHLRHNHFEACIPFEGLTAREVYHPILTQEHF